MNKIKQILFSLFFLIYFSPVSGQQPSFNQLSVENGLSHNSVFAIAQDSQGFMWYGTNYGLNRYDGRHFKIYRNNKADIGSLSNNAISALLCDSKQTIWVGTENKLNKYDPVKNSFEKITLPKNEWGGANPDFIICLYEDRKKNLWVGTANGLYILDDRNINRFKKFGVYGANGIAGNSIRCIYEDTDHNLWVGTGNGLTRIHSNNGEYTYTTFRHDPKNQLSISDNFITSITEDQQKNIWVSTQTRGLNLFDKFSQSFTRLLHTPANTSGIINNNIRKLITDKSGRLWIGTQEGLSIMDPVTRQCISYQYDPGNKQSLSQNSVHSLFEDANASVWIGTFFGGVNIAYSYATSFTTWQSSKTQSSISNNVVSSVVADEKDNLWIGTEGGGLNYFDKVSGRFTNYKNKLNESHSLGSNLVKKVYRDKDGNIWVGTHAGGLNLFDPATRQFKRYLYKENDNAFQRSEIVAILEDSDGRLWTGTQGATRGLNVFSRNKTLLEDRTDSSLVKAVATKNIKVLYEDAQKNIWAGTGAGLYVLKKNAVSFQPVSIADGNNDLQSAVINCIQQDAKGRLWVGVEYGGLRQYDIKTEQVIEFSEKEGLPHNNVLGILEDDKHQLWISTGNGLARFDPATKTFRTYTASDGLPGNGFNYNSFYKSPHGEMFFGGYNGLTSFFPDKIETNTHSSPVVFTGLRLFNNPVAINGEDGLLEQDINFTKKITLKYNQDVFTIEFALLNFIRSEKNKYTYKLEGFDKDWNETNATGATYMNLPSGSYTFLLKGANNDGVWSQPSQLQIKILPPFWKTWWAYCLYIITVGAILFFVFRFIYLRALLKTEDELHQVKLNFFTNISHEIRTHLTLIMAPIDKMLENKKQDGLIQQQLTHVKSNANRLLKLVSELMDFRKAETENLTLNIARHDLVSFLYDIYTSFQDLSLTKVIKISFVHDGENVPVYFDKEQLEKVFFNLLTNAFKFTPEGGRISMNLEQKNNKVLVSVTDNGRGIAPQFREKLFTNFFQVADHGLQNTGYGIGLALSKNIVELHKGSITVESEPATADKEGRTNFTVTLLTGNKHFEGTQHIQENISVPKNVVDEPQIPQQLVIATPLIDEIKDKQFTILVAEDNDELRSLIMETFENQYAIIECENGLKAWETATEQIPDIIISDVMMPEMDGFTLCHQLKTDKRTSHIPVILLTAKSSQADQVSGLETGADIYITKPFATKVLELSVRNLLASREKMRQKFSRQLITEPIPYKTTAEAVEDSFVNVVDKEFLEKVIQLIEDHMDDPEFGVTMLSRKCAMSPPVLYKKIKAVTDMSVNDFVKSLRLKKAAQLLQQKDLTVYEVAYAVGYNDRKYFSQEFKKQFGKTPSEYASSSLAEKKPCK